jgi:hypothetical protein
MSAPQNVLADALDRWRVELDTEPDEIEAARAVCQESRLDEATLSRAVGLVAETYPSDPDGWPRDAWMTEPADHLRLILAGIRAELIRGEPGDGRKLWNAYLHGPYCDEQEAAYQALEQDGGLDYLDELSPHDRRRQRVPAQLLDEARVIADNTGAAPQWVDVDGIGWVVFSQV